MQINRSENIQGLLQIKNYNQLFCLTLYNEEAKPLADTLASIARNVNNLPNSPTTVVTIIADGKDKLSASSKHLLSQLGLVSQLSNNAQDDIIDCVSVTVPLSLVANIFFNNDIDIHYSKKMTIVLCTKNINSGKLDSHWWFFKKIAPVFEPDYCYQIDAGTILNDDAIANMRARFDAKPTTAALASNVLIAPKDHSNFLDSFQVGDFAVQKALMWPSDALLGYLSVVPGQFCGFRYSALAKNNSNDIQSPIDLYLRGMDCDSAFEKTMFLAEDRVMGFEILAHKGSDNRLAYCEDSICYTDECSTVKEFLGQRRRWVNSAFMCRTWMMASMGRYFKHSASSISTKCHTALSLSNMVSNHLLEWFQPLISLLILIVTYLSTNKIGLYFNTDKTIIFLADLLITLIWIAPLLLSTLNILQRMSLKAVNYLFKAVAINVALVLFINIYASTISLRIEFWSSFSFIYIALFSSCAWLSALFLGRQTIFALAQSYIQYILLTAPINLMMFCYAFLNIDDSSWGTKGLDRSMNSASKDTHSLESKLKRFRNYFVLAWLSSNLAAVVIAIHYQLFYSFLMVTAILSLFIAITGLVGVFSLSINRAFSKSPDLELNDLNE